MSDNATLVERSLALEEDLRFARARIAELEAERDEARKLANLYLAMWREAEQDLYGDGVKP